MRKIVFILFTSVMLMDCSPLRQYTESEISVLGSTWEYTDEDWTYQIEFGPNGQLKTTHPNDVTPENDTWKQSKDEIHFEFNDGYSNYKGKLKTLDVIIGEGSSNGMKWSWKMKKIE